MRKVFLLLIIFLSIVIFLPVFFTGCSGTSASGIKVVTGSTLLAYIAQQVAGDRVEVINLIPASQHPGDFNARPSDIQTLAQARLFLLHGWPGEGYADKMVSAANNPDLTVIKANINGNWMIPEIQSAGVDKVTEALIQIDKAGTEIYQKNAAEYKHRIEAKASEIQNMMTQAGVSQINVIASVRQADFLQWAGFKVVATYTSPDELTPQVVKDLVDRGKAENVQLVVNNLQDSMDAGKGIASEIGATNVNLSNFPGGFENTETWEKAIDKNVSLLMEAMGK